MKRIVFLGWAAAVAACGGSANLLLSLDAGSADGATKGVSHDATAGTDAARDAGQGARADGSVGPLACTVPHSNFNCDYWRGVLSCGPVDGSEVTCLVDSLDGGCGRDGGPDADSCIDMCHSDEYAIGCSGPPRPDGGQTSAYIPEGCRFAGSTGYGCCPCSSVEDAGSDAGASCLAQGSHYGCYASATAAVAAIEKLSNGYNCPEGAETFRCPGSEVCWLSVPTAECTDTSGPDAGSDGACGVAPWITPGSKEPAWVTNTCPDAGCAAGTVCVSSFGPFLNPLGCAPIPAACNGTCACMSCVCDGARLGCADSDGGLLCQTGLP